MGRLRDVFGTLDWDEIKMGLNYLQDISNSNSMLIYNNI